MPHDRRLSDRICKAHQILKYYNIDNNKCNIKPKRSKNNGPLWDSLLTTGRQFYLLFVHRFAVYNFGFATLLISVMQLLEHRFELAGYRQAEVGGVLQDAEAVVGDGPEDDGGAQDTGLVQDMHVQHLGDAHQQEGQHLPAEASKAHGGTELSVLDGAHDAGEVVHDHEDQQRVEQAVASAQEIAEPCADGGERSFDDGRDEMRKQVLKHLFTIWQTYLMTGRDCEMILL